MPSEPNLIDSLVNSNQNTHRLNSLKKFDELSSEAQQDIDKLLNSRGDRAHHALGVLLWAFISKNTPVAVISCRDLNALILEASARLTEGTFDVRSSRVAFATTTKKTKTLWAQLTAVYTANEIITIVKPWRGQVPAVVELIHPQLLKHIPVKATDELRLKVVNSTVSKGKMKFTSMKDFKTSMLQDSNTTRPQGLDTTSLQYSNTTSQSVTQNVTGHVTQPEADLEDFALDKINF
jgi:hypothetical protein